MSTLFELPVCAFFDVSLMRGGAGPDAAEDAVVYSSMIANWRKQVGVADRAALAPKRRGPKPDGSARQIQQLERDVARLRHKLDRAELIIDAQKKLCVALGLPTTDDPSGDARCSPWTNSPTYRIE